MAGSVALSHLMELAECVINGRALDRFDDHLWMGCQRSWKVRAIIRDGLSIMQF